MTWPEIELPWVLAVQSNLPWDAELEWLTNSVHPITLHLMVMWSFSPHPAPLCTTRELQLRSLSRRNLHAFLMGSTYAGRFDRFWPEKISPKTGLNTLRLKPA
jgi:hypothetical protein